MLYAAMVRAGSIVMLAETVGPVAASSGRALGLSIIVSGGAVNQTPIIVDIAVMSG
jgi:hypothetical protein